MKSWFFVFIFIFPASVVLASTSKDDLQQSLISSVRDNYGELKDAQVLVKKIEYFEDYAYFCGIGLDSAGNPINSQYFVAVYDMLMRRSGDGKWKQIANFNSFTLPSAKITCHLSEGIKSFLPKMSRPGDACISVDKGTAERMNILDALREVKDQRFLVTRLCKTSSMAYFCGASLDKKTGFIIGTDNAIDVSDVIFRKNAYGQWSKVVDLGKFALSPDTITCLFGNEGVFLGSDILQDVANKLKDDDI